MKLKAQEIRNMSREDVTKKIAELEEELFNLRFQAKMGQLANALQLHVVRRTIARVKTIQKQMIEEARSPK
jgi:large subunit ribosomal protein L29